EVAHLVPSDPPGPYGLYQPMASVSAAREWVAVGRDAVRILYLYDLSGVLTASEPQPISTGFERLSVVRPNPFAATAEATRRLDRAEHVDAVLYGAPGRAVAGPSGGLAPAGETILSVSGDGRPPGLYLLRVWGEGWEGTRRLVRTEG